MYAEAVEKLNTAVARATKNYTSPKDGEALYYLGVALKAQHKNNEAYDAFYKATWSLAWRSAAYYALAQLDCTAGAYDKAVVHLDESLATNTQNTTALNLKTAVLRKRGAVEPALANAEQTLAFDPLDPWSLYEFSLCRTAAGLTSAARKPLEQLKAAMERDEQVALEIAIDYANAGLWTEALGVLEIATAEQRTGRRNPMVWYWLGWLHDKCGETDKARECFKRAAAMPPEYCFPFRNESIEVLTKAQEYNPDDARAPYYLGNLLYERQPENAIGEWEKSRRLDDGFATVHRNLGFAYGQVRNDLPVAIASMEKAIACDDTDARLFFELDELYEAAGVDPRKRLAVLDAHAAAVAKRDDAMTRYVSLQVWAGQYDKAIQTLTSRHFNKWEGGGEIHDIYVDAHLLRGLKQAGEKNWAGAIADYQAALEYPDNLEVGRPEFDEKAYRTYFLMAMAHGAAAGHDWDRVYAATEKHDKVSELFQKVVSVKTDDSEIRYFQALSHIKLGDGDNMARPIFEDLLRIGNERLQRAGGEDFFAKFGQKASRNRQLAQAHFVLALGSFDDKAKVTEHLTEALELDPTHVWAKYMLSPSGQLQNPQTRED
jgi:tetratricopeptide (TPR) repeat protein